MVTVRDTINGIKGAVSQSWFLRKSSYNPKPITAKNGMEMGNINVLNPRKAKKITPMPDNKRINSPIENGGWVIPRIMLARLVRHIKKPMKIITFF
jgi:hypothetical protein